MKNNLLVLTAPPASGKTYLIENLSRDLGQELLVISPLRALANECQAKWGDTICVMTPEEWSGKKKISPIVVLDEFHLFFYWGDTFRPRMWEAFYELVQAAELVIVLTATLTPEMLEWMKDSHCQFDQRLWIDHGNQRLRNRPTRYYRIENRTWMEMLILENPPNCGTHLIFCQYRTEVQKWERQLRERGYRVWSCMGGEAAAFSVRSRVESSPDFIVATTVLSHGVNLPAISRIYFLYRVQDINFLIQMVARGGRRGEEFEVYAMENPHGIKWRPVLNCLAIERLRIKMNWQHSFKQIQEWFLKA
jgi:superfamily II DNA helicase RecQ